MSKVALSYRTNEWAKHLSAAEAPLDDIQKPQVEASAPVSEEIARPLLVSKRSSHRVSSGSIPKRSSGFTRPTSAVPRYSQGEIQPLSRQSSVLASGGITRTTSQMQDRSGRHSATHLVPVVEPTSQRISSAPSPIPSNTLLNERETLLKNKVYSHGFDSQSPSTHSLVTPTDQDNVILAERKRALQHQKPPSSSHKYKQANWGVSNQAQGFDSHQPQRSPNTASDERREALLAGWRSSIRGTPMETGSANDAVSRAALTNAKRQKELEQEQQSKLAQQRESMMSSMMRSNEMLDAHQRAMRRMQAKANKNAA